MRSRLGIDPKRIAAGGGSAGGHVAAATGVCNGFEDPDDSNAEVSSKADALLLFNPVYDNGPEGYGALPRQGTLPRYLTSSQHHP